MYLCCAHCGNIVAELEERTTVIRLNVRGKRRRTYKVSSIESVVCDWCGRESAPMAQVVYQARAVLPPASLQPA